MAQKDISSMRSTLEFLEEENEVLVVKGEVDPISEIAGIEKAFEGGVALLFENIRGYLAAFCYRLDRRFWESQLFDRLLAACLHCSTVTFAELKA